MSLCYTKQDKDARKKRKWHANTHNGNYGWKNANKNISNLDGTTHLKKSYDGRSDSTTGFFELPNK